MACKVKVNQHDRLAFRLYWTDSKLGRLESWEGTGLGDNAKNRKRVEARAVLITEEMENGTFNYLKRFPDGNKAELFKPKDEQQPQTVGEYYGVWIESKKPPFVRAGLERDYREHFKRLNLAEPSLMPVSVPW